MAASSLRPAACCALLRVALLGCLAAGAVSEATEGIFFDYAYHGQDWTQGQCGSRERQSPIDFGGSAPWSKAPEGQFFFNYEPVREALIQNNGHAIAVELGGEGVGGITYNNMKFSIESMTFHVMSEHLYRGAQYPLEVHLVHRAEASERALVVAIGFHVPPPAVPVDISWKTIYSRGSFGETLTPPGIFNAEFQQTLSGIIKRECANCSDTHKEVYYKRKVHDWKYNAFQDLLVQWSGEGVHTKFDIYSTLLDANMGTNAWQVCDGMRTEPNPVVTEPLQPPIPLAFPGYCGPLEYVTDSWTTLDNLHGQKNYKWSVRREVPKGYALMGEGRCAGTAFQKTSPNAPSPDLSLGTCAAECNIKQACQAFTITKAQECMLYDASAQGCLARIPADGSFVSYSRLPTNVWTAPPPMSLALLQEALRTGQEVETEKGQRESFLQRRHATRSAQKAKEQGGPSLEESIGSNIALATTLAGGVPVKEEKLQVPISPGGINFLSPLLAGGTFFEYDGSLTAPPCTEQVTWLVRREPMSSSIWQQGTIQTAIMKATADTGNNRSPMPLMGRQILVKEAVAGKPPVTVIEGGQPPGPPPLAQNELASYARAQNALDQASMARRMQMKISPLVNPPPPPSDQPRGLALGAMAPPAVQQAAAALPEEREAELPAAAGGASVRHPLGGLSQAMSSEVSSAEFYAQQAAASMGDLPVPSAAASL